MKPQNLQEAASSVLRNEKDSGANLSEGSLPHTAAAKIERSFKLWWMKEAENLAAALEVDADDVYEVGKPVADLVEKFGKDLKSALKKL